MILERKQLDKRVWKNWIKFKNLTQHCTQVNSRSHETDELIMDNTL